MTYVYTVVQMAQTVHEQRKKRTNDETQQPLLEKLQVLPHKQETVAGTSKLHWCFTPSFVSHASLNLW